MEVTTRKLLEDPQVEEFEFEKEGPLQLKGAGFAGGWKGVWAVLKDGQLSFYKSSKVCCVVLCCGVVWCGVVWCVV